MLVAFILCIAPHTHTHTRSREVVEGEEEEEVLNVFPLLLCCLQYTYTPSLFLYSSSYTAITSNTLPLQSLSPSRVRGQLCVMPLSCTHTHTHDLGGAGGEVDELFVNAHTHTSLLLSLFFAVWCGVPMASCAA